MERKRYALGSESGAGHITRTKSIFHSFVGQCPSGGIHNWFLTRPKLADRRNRALIRTREFLAWVGTALVALLLLNQSLFCQTGQSVQKTGRLPQGVDLLSLRGRPVWMLWQNDRSQASAKKGSLDFTYGSAGKLSQYGRSDAVQFVSVPGPSGGTIRSIATDDEGRLFVSTDGGVYRSADNGLHWNYLPFPTQLFNIVEPVTVLENNMIAAETDFNDFISTDAGDSWDYTAFHGFAVGTDGVMYAAANYAGIFKSVDTAKIWTPFALEGKNIYKVILCGAGRFVCPSDSGLFFSDDGGVTWIFREYGSDFSGTVVSDSHGRLFSTFGAKVAISSDFGASWRLIALPDSLSYDNVYRLYIGRDDRLFALTQQCIFVSSDHGETWKDVGFPHGIPLTVGEDQNGRLLVGSFYGIYREDQTTHGWEAINSGIHAMRIERIQFTSAGSILVISLGDCFRSTDDGNSWTKVSFDSSEYVKTYPPMISTSNGYLFLTASFDGGLLRSSDDGVSWKKIPVQSNVYAINGITEREPGDILAGTTYGDIYRSTDYGDSWIEVLSGAGQSIVTCLASDKLGNSYAANDSSVLISRDGKSWKKIPLKLGYSPFNSISIDYGGGVFLASSYEGVFHSSDRGATWNPMNEGLTDTFVMSTAADDSGNVVLGTSSGIFGLADSLDHWTWISAGFPSTFTTALSISPDGYVFAGTQSFGLYKSVSPMKARYRITLPPDGQPVMINLSQNYPNPFNPTTTINYSISRSGRVTLKLYDILGRIMKTVVDGIQSAGYHQLSVNASGLATGVYFYRLQAGGMVQTRKLVILK